jgi:hypothetical protein
LIEAIDRSLHEVRLETYIFNAEASGSEAGPLPLEPLLAVAWRCTW